MRLPISIKLIILTSLLLLGVTIPIALQSSKYFEKVARQREENVNLDSAAGRAAEVENILGNLLYKTKSTALTLMNLVKDKKTQSDELDLNFERVGDFLAIEILEVDGSGFRQIASRVKKQISDVDKTQPNFFLDLRANEQFPLRSVSQGNIEVVNGSLKNAPPIFTIGIPIVKNAQGKITHVALADFQLAALQRPFSEQGERTFYLLDKRGVVLAHAEEEKALSKFSYAQNEVFKAADASLSPRGQKLFTDPDTKSRFYGAFAKTSFAVTVFSQISEDVILEPAVQVKREAYFVAGMALSGAIFIIFLFSMSMTSPIETLAELIHLVSKGNFDVNAKAKIHSFFNDEVTELAGAFDEMTVGLKERDKVKNLFNKFHGQSVTEDLMKGELVLGGESKEVVVFFSDIRGFTAYSEQRPAEEVVAMLNEYFAAMVEVINRHEGVVDKFIGDAIMAVWGVPKSSGRDAKNAVTACLEMRRTLAVLNEKRIARGQIPINIGMGLHAGLAISGTIGSEERMEYTIIGNTVNTGSRIEASTKSFGSDLLISDNVSEKLDDQFLIEYAGAVEAKGLTHALKLYKVRGYKSETGEIIEVKTAYSDYEADESTKKIKIA